MFGRLYNSTRSEDHQYYSRKKQNDFYQFNNRNKRRNGKDGTLPVEIVKDGNYCLIILIGKLV